MPATFRLWGLAALVAGAAAGATSNACGDARARPDVSAADRLERAQRAERGCPYAPRRVYVVTPGPTAVRADRVTAHPHDHIRCTLVPAGPWGGGAVMHCVAIRHDPGAVH